MSNATTDPNDNTTWRFANAVLTESNRELRVAGELVHLESKPFAVLLCLLRAEGELVTKRELFDQVWPGRIVTDGVLSQAILMLRQALGDQDKTLLRTVHGHGYRLDAAIEIEGDADSLMPQLDLAAGKPAPMLEGWILCERLQTRPSNELWQIRCTTSGELGVLKLALDARAERALQREVTLNRVLQQELGDNPPLVPIVQWQFEQQPCWVRMPWYEAGSLADWVRRAGGAEKIGLTDRVRLIADAAEVFAKAYALGIMHKDIKPGNLLVDDRGGDPRLMLCDFGSGTATSRARLARAGVTVMGFTQTMAVEQTADSLSGSSTTTGTPAYMAPELLEGGVFSERSDVFSLGVLLYQVISGNMARPLAAGWEDEIQDTGLQDIIRVACAGRPEKRIAGMHEFAQRLRSWTPATKAPSPSPTVADGMRLSAIMFTDMAGYSRLVRGNESLARELLDHHLATMRELLPLHHGREVEIIGDAFLVEFPSAVLATRCAVAFQKAQAEYNAIAAPERRYQIRIGIHIGDVESKGGSLYGHGVNYAARIEPLSPPGGIAVSPAVNDAVAARLNLPFVSLGKHHLKNVAENIEIFALDEAAIRTGVSELKRPRSWGGHFGPWPAVAVVVAMAVLALFYVNWQAHEPASARTPSQAPANAEPVRVAILPFELLGLDERTSQIMRGLQDALSADLVGQPGWNLVLGKNLEAMDLSDAPAEKIGAALNATRLIRGSILQFEQELRATVQLVDSATGVTAWARTIEGNRGDLFGLQRRIGNALLQGMGGAPMPFASRPIDPQAYENYLLALAIYRQFPWLDANASRVEQLLTNLDRSIAIDPSLVEARTLAVLALANAYNWSFRNIGDVRGRLDEHLGALKQLAPDSLNLQLATAAEELYVLHQATAALARLEPYREAMLDRPEQVAIYLEALRCTGQSDQAIATGRAYLQRQPTDLVNAIRHVNDLWMMGEAAAMMQFSMTAAARFPATSVIREFASDYAFELTGDERMLRDEFLWPEGSAPLSDEVIQFRQVSLAYMRGDLASARAMLEKLPARDSRWWGHSFTPAPNAAAYRLFVVGGADEERRQLANQALRALQSIRETSDSPARQIAQAQALALLDRASEARALLNQAVETVLQTDSTIYRDNALNGAASVFAILGDAEEVIKIWGASRFKGETCGGMLYDYSGAPFQRNPTLKRYLHDVCDERTEPARRALEPYLRTSQAP